VTASSEAKTNMAAAGAQIRRFISRYPAAIGMPALTAAFLAATVAIHPQFSSFDTQSLAMGAMPLAFAAAAQTVVVISGGIDLSVGSAMAVANVLAARTMEQASFGESLLLSPGPPSARSTA
jgi:ribose transport system permease protein